MSIALRHPTADDGLAVHQLVIDTGVLDVNSSYAYVAHLHHFASSCVVAVLDGRIVGFVTGYLLPEQPDTLFVWQVGVSSAARGKGLAKRMLRWLLAAQPGATWLHTTVTPDNTASIALFHSLARSVQAELEVVDGFSTAQLGGGHLPENLFRIGPISQENL